MYSYSSLSFSNSAFFKELVMFFLDFSICCLILMSDLSELQVSSLTLRSAVFSANLSLKAASYFSSSGVMPDTEGLGATFFESLEAAVVPAAAVVLPGAFAAAALLLVFVAVPGFCY